MKNDTAITDRSKFESTTNIEKDENFQKHMLPSWDLLEYTLNRELATYDQMKPNFCENNKDVNVEYLLIKNDSKQSQKNHKG
jgi:hypothetical protein